MYYERKHFFTIVGNIKDAHEGKLDFLNTDNLGTLFNYGLVYHIQIQKELREDNEMPSIIKHYFGNLSNLMEYKDVDLNFAGKILGFNDFDNLKYSDSSELDIISSCLDHVSNSWQEELRNISDDRNLLGKKNYVPYTKDSPCSMIIIPKSCVAFCKWFEEMRQILEKEKILAIMRYIEAIRHILYSRTPIFDGWPAKRCLLHRVAQSPACLKPRRAKAPARLKPPYQLALSPAIYPTTSTSRRIASHRTIAPPDNPPGRIRRDQPRI